MVTLDEVIAQIDSCECIDNEDFVSTPETKEFLKNRWDETVSDLGILDDQGWFERLWTLHTTDRHYHSAVHLKEMIMYYEIVSDYLSFSPFESNAIIFASFFHDAIYDVHSSTNEEDSAKLFLEFAKDMGLERCLQDTVEQYILKTKSHKVEDDAETAESFFLDTDMAVLGKSAQAYKMYASLIRKEYEYVPLDVYCSKRPDILEKFLENPRIYGTELMHKALEKRARENITKEIEDLRSMLS